MFLVFIGPVVHIYRYGFVELLWPFLILHKKERARKLRGLKWVNIEEEKNYRWSIFSCQVGPRNTQLRVWYEILKNVGKLCEDPDTQENRWRWRHLLIGSDIEYRFMLSEAITWGCLSVWVKVEILRSAKLTQFHLHCRAVDLHSFFAVPDPVVFLNADLDADPDPEPALQNL